MSRNSFPQLSRFRQSFVVVWQMAQVDRRSWQRHVLGALSLLGLLACMPAGLSAQCNSNLPSVGAGVGFAGNPLGTGDALVIVTPPLTPSCMAFGLCTTLNTNGFAVVQDSCPTAFAPGQHWEFLWKSADSRIVKFTTDERPTIPQCNLSWPRPTLTLTIPPSSNYKWVHNFSTGLVSVILESDTLRFTVRETDDSSATANHVNAVLNNCIDTTWVTCSSLTWGFFNEPRPSIVQVGNELVAPDGLAYQWLLNGTVIPGATDTTYFPPQPGLYSVLVTFNANCSLESDSIQFDFVGLDPLHVQPPTVQVYPNPFSHTFSVSMEQARAASVRISIMDMAGNIVLERRCDPLHQKIDARIDLSGFPQGIFLLQVESKGVLSVQKLVKLDAL